MTANEVPITITSFPRLGTKGVFTSPYYPPTGPTSRSQFIPDECISPHIRFPTLTANIRTRRGCKVAINMPVFYDENTPKPFNDPTIDYDRHLYPEDDDVRNGAAKEGHIYMDTMGFGMGCCCLQITLQAKNITEARTLYDQLCPLGPIMLALTACAPIFKGFLADVDVRWNVISGAVDDRTEEERGIKPLKNNRWKIPKSRYDSVSAYLSEDPRLRPEYNDLDLVIDQDIKKRLIDNGMTSAPIMRFALLSHLPQEWTNGCRRISLTCSFGIPLSSSKRHWMNPQKARQTTLRTSSPRTGSTCASSPRQWEATSVGVSSSEAWRFR
jgi:glutamate--cysteine ligase catalytic subunit